MSLFLVWLQCQGSAVSETTKVTNQQTNDNETCECAVAPPPTIVQTEAERRRREARVQQNGLRSCLFVCICKFFKDISRSKALSESKVASCYSPVNSTLHRHDIIRVRFLTSARHVKTENKYCFIEGAFKKMHVYFGSSIFSVRKTGVTEK